MAVNKKDVEEKAPDNNLTYKSGTENKKLFMSYGMLNRLTRACPDIEKLLAISAFPEVQEAILRTLLAPEDEDGRPDPENFDMDRDTSGITAEVIQDIIMWAVGHMSHFFIGLADKNLSHALLSRKALNQIQKRAESLIDLNNGSPA